VAWQGKKADVPATAAADALRPMIIIQRWMRVLLSFFLCSNT
jgi:hypothetical protein